MLNFRKQTPEQASLDLAIEGMKILSSTILLAVQQLKEEGMEVPKMPPFLECLALRNNCRQFLKQSGLDVGVSRRQVSRWVNASYDALGLLIIVVEMFAASRVKNRSGSPIEAKFEFPSPLVFLEKAKACEWGEYVDWAQDMSRSIVGDVGVQVDVLRHQLDQ